MYKLKEKLNIENQKDFAEEVGISEQHLSRIQNNKQLCSKLTAYCITKHFNNELEINDLFELVK